MSPYYEKHLHDVARQASSLQMKYGCDINGLFSMMKSGQLDNGDKTQVEGMYFLALIHTGVLH